VLFFFINIHLNDPYLIMICANDEYYSYTLLIFN